PEETRSGTARRGALRSEKGLVAGPRRPSAEISLSAPHGDAEPREGVDGGVQGKDPIEHGDEKEDAGLGTDPLVKREHYFDAAAQRAQAAAGRTRGALLGLDVHDAFDDRTGVGAVAEIVEAQHFLECLRTLLTADHRQVIEEEV